MSEYRSFVVPYDFSEHSQAALEVAKDLARRLESELHLLHVVTPPIYASAYGAAVPPQIDMEPIRTSVMESLREITERAGDAPVKMTAHVIEGLNIAATIQEFASKHTADLIVMGTHGRTGLAHVFLGSVAERTLRHAPCPVLTVPVPAES
jgi:nucleotide-binding universal stress UspA family protein